MADRQLCAVNCNHCDQIQGFFSSNFIHLLSWGNMIKEITNIDGIKIFSRNQWTAQSKSQQKVQLKEAHCDLSENGLHTPLLQNTDQDAPLMLVFLGPHLFQAFTASLQLPYLYFTQLIPPLIFLEFRQAIHFGRSQILKKWIYHKYWSSIGES